MREPKALVLRRTTAASPPSPWAMCAAARAAPRRRSVGANAAAGTAACWESAAGVVGTPRAEGVAEDAASYCCTRSAAQCRGTRPTVVKGDRGRPVAAAAAGGRQWSS